MSKPEHNGSQSTSIVGNRVSEPAIPLIGLAQPRQAQLEAFCELRWEEGRAKFRGDTTCFLGSKYADPRAASVYSGWTWNGERLQAFNDKFGYFPMFYCCEPDRLLISPSIVRLLKEGAGRQLDFDALALFLRLGYHVGEDTAFRSIRVLPPDANLEWKSGELQLRGGFTVPNHSDLTWKQSVDAFIELVSQAISRTVVQESRVALPLSGGKDSRHLLLGLMELGRKPDICLTYRHMPWRADDDYDTTLAGIIASRAGVRHAVLQQPRNEASLEREKNRRTQFSSADEHAQCLVVDRYIENRWDVLYDGIAGDVLSGYSRYIREDDNELLRKGHVTQLAARLLRPEGLLPRVLLPEAYRDMSRDRAIARLERELKRHQDAPAPVSSFAFWNRSRRSVATIPFGIYAQRHVVTPFLDHDIYEVMAALPNHVLAAGPIHTTAMRRAFPEFADIPFGHELTGTDRLPPKESQRWPGFQAAAYNWQLGLSTIRSLGPRSQTLLNRRFVTAKSAQVLVRAPTGKSPLRVKDDVFPWLPRISLFLGELAALSSNGSPS